MSVSDAGSDDSSSDWLKVDFIIVNGPFKAGKEQWPMGNDEEIKDWTEQAIPEHFPSAQIKRFDCSAEDESAEFWSRKGFTDTAVKLLEFVDEQGIAAKGRHIVFISHGFGGSLVKKVLTMACSDTKYASIPAATRGLAFFTTPHRTEAHETWEDVVFRMLWDEFHDGGLKPWKISEMASILRDLQHDYSFIAESWPTVNVYSDPYESSTPKILTEHNNSFGGYNGLRYGRRRLYQEICKFEEDDADVRDLMVTLKERVSGGYAECMQTLNRLAPALPMPLAYQVDTSTLPGKLLNNEKYTAWEDSDKSTALLLTGNPGSGRTYLFHLLFYFFREQEINQCVTLFSFDGSDARRNSTASFLISFIRQSLLIAPEAFPRIESVFEQTVQSGRSTREDLLVLCRALLRGLEGETLKICINRIDECGDLPALVFTLKMLAKSKNPTIKLVLTSAPSTTVLEALNDTPVISIDSKVNDIPEFKEFVERRVVDLGKERPVLDEFSKEIMDKVASCDNFLQVSLFLNQLYEATMLSTPTKIRSRVQSTDYELHKIVHSALKRDLPEWASTALCFMVHAVRPMNANELAVAAALPDHFTSLSGLDEILQRDIFEDLRQVFGLLVKLHDGEIRFVHQVAQEIVSKEYPGVLGAKHSPESMITRLCIDYLCTDEVKALAQSPQPKGAWVSRQKGVFALTRYAAKYWPLHYRRIPSTESLAEFVAEKLDDPSFLQTWSALLPDSRTPGSDEISGPTKPLHYAAELGFSAVMDILLNFKDSADEIEPDDLALALELASRNGHSEVVERLLDYGIENTNTILRALEEPCRNGLDDVANALVQKLAELEPEDLVFPNSLLGQAARNGHASVVDILLRAGAPVSELFDNSTPLHLAVTEGHDAVVDVLIEGGAGVDVEDDRGSTPLHLASSNGYPSIVKKLLDASASPDDQDSDHLTALHLAVKQGDVSSVKLLLDGGASPSISTNIETSPLHTASQDGREEIVRLLLDVNVDINKEDDTFGTALLYACENGHETIARLLIEKGANPDGATNADNTPLYWSVQQEKDEIANLLLEKGADPNRLSGGQSVLVEAARLGKLEIVRALLDKGANVTDNRSWMPIHAAAGPGYHEIVGLLIDKGADPNKPTDVGKTALHLAAESAQLDVAKLLLEKGADLAATDENKVTALHFAARSGNVDIVNLMLEKGADIEALDDDRRRPLHAAADYGSPDTVKLLLEKGAKYDEDDKWLNTPLILSVNCSNEENVRTLLKKGADPRHKNSDGDTPLHRAAWNGNIELMEILTKDGEVNVDIRSENDETPLFRAFFYEVAVKWLLDKGANPNAEAKDGSTPLMFMARKGDVNSSKLLVERGANIHAVDEYEATALHHACSSSEPVIVDMLLANGANPNVRNSHQRTPLILAAMEGYQIIAEALVKKGADIDVTDYHLNTPLQMAAYYGRSSVVRLLLDEKAALEIEDADGDTALMNAVKGGDIESAKMLLEAGANREAVNKEGNTPLLAAVRDRNMATEMIGALTQYAINLDARAPDKKSAVHIAAAHCDFQTLHLLIKAKADLNLQDEHGRTPLHYAAQRNRPDAVIALIEAGANREIKDIQGRTLIHCAVPHYSLNDLSNLVSKVLKIRGSRPRQLNEPDVDGWTPIHWACKGGENGVIRLLRAAQANPTKRDKKGWTPRHIAIFHNRKDLLAYLKPDEIDKRRRRDPATSPVLAKDRKESTANSPTTSDLVPLQRRPTDIGDDDASTDGGMTENEFKTGGEHFAYCDSCYAYIWGIRFKCEDCPDYDFCFKCMWHCREIHDTSHKFRRIGSGPDQGPYSFKAEEERTENNEVEAAPALAPAPAAAPAVVVNAEGETTNENANAEVDANANINVVVDGEQADAAAA